MSDLWLALLPIWTSYEFRLTLDFILIWVIIKLNTFETRGTSGKSNETRGTSGESNV